MQELYLVTHLLNCICTCIATIATHHKEHVNSPHINTLDNFAEVSTPAAGAKDGASLQLNVVYCAVRKNDWLTGCVVEPLKAIPAFTLDSASEWHTLLNQRCIRKRSNNSTNVLITVCGAGSPLECMLHRACHSTGSHLMPKMLPSGTP